MASRATGCETVAVSEGMVGEGASYREHLPRPELQRSIACYWTLEASAAAPSRILPDGSMDLLFDLSGTHEPSVVGTMTRALVSTPTGDRIDLLGVRFLPGEGTSFLLGSAARPIRDSVVPLVDAWGPVAREIGERLLSAAVSKARIALLDAELARWRKLPADPRVRHVVRAMRETHGGVRVHEVAALVGLGERQLERLFDERVGIGPKALALVMRVQALLTRVGPMSDWSRLAAELGWSDQAHLTRDLGRLAGVTPAALGRALRRKAEPGMSDSFNLPHGPLPILAT